MKQPTCKYCLGEGYYALPQGEEDFYNVYCDCDAGLRLQDERYSEETRREQQLEQVGNIMGAINQAVYGENPFKRV